MSMSQVCMIILLLALLLASARYLLSLRRSELSRRPKIWRVIAILSLQTVSAALLYFCLFPPSTLTSAERLVILTANADMENATISGRLLALPEAPVFAKAEPVPDLATALRRYPGVSQLHIIGNGLGPRDLEAARGLSIDFTPAPLPKALVQLSLPNDISSGARWSLQGRVHQIKNARIELLDPANAVVASADIDAEGYFSLADTARSPGLVMYQLRILDERKKIVENIRLPLLVEQSQALKMLSLSGGPNPELKYLRRWALDAGVELQSQITLSAGVQMNSSAIAINAQSLRSVDLLMLDERAWASMNRSSKQALIDALRSGMGVLLRISGPLSAADRNDLRALGFAVADANIVQGIHLANSGDKKSKPTLTRRPLQVASSDGVTMLRDDSGNPLAVWRAEGRGRIGLVWLTDTYKLVLGDQSSLHGQIWRDAVATLARVRPGNTPYLRGQNTRMNDRSVLCNISGKAFIREPDKKITSLMPETQGLNKNCAAFWPRISGWHVLVTDSQELPFHVRGNDEAPGLKANDMREATLLLMSKSVTEKNVARIPVPGSPWPWFYAWLFFTALLWWLERSKWGTQ